MRQHACKAARQGLYDNPLMQRTAECTTAARRTDMKNKTMQAEGSRPKSIKSKSTRSKVARDTRMTGTEPSS